MEKKTNGTVISVKTQWWLKVNTKAVRFGPLDGATFPHIIKVKYTVDGVEYVKRKWLGASVVPPVINDQVTVIYQEGNPTKIKINVGESL